MPVPGASPLAPQGSVFRTNEALDHASIDPMEDVLSATPYSSRRYAGRRSQKERFTDSRVGNRVDRSARRGGRFNGVANEWHVQRPSDDAAVDHSVAEPPRAIIHKPADPKSTHSENVGRPKAIDPTKSPVWRPDGSRPTVKNPNPATQRPRPKPSDAPSDSDESPEQMDLKRSLEKPPK